MRLQGKVAIITGAGQGLGRAYALRFVAEGAKVAIAEINDANAEQVAKEIEAGGGEAIALHVDVSDEASTQAMADATVEKWGRIDILLNNAGVFFDLEQTNNSLEYLRKILDVNMIGPWLCTRAVLPTMRAQGKGKIINQSSGAAWMYAAAGYALNPEKGELPRSRRERLHALHGGCARPVQHQRQRDRARRHDDRSDEEARA